MHTVHLSSALLIAAILSGWPLLADRTAIDGMTTAYICLNNVCTKPMTDRAELATVLAELAMIPKAVVQQAIQNDRGQE